MSFIASSLVELPSHLGHIFYTIVLPILLLAAVGWVLQRKCGLDMKTLKLLNFYFVIPVLIYYSLVTSSLTWAAAWQVVAFTVAMVVAQSALAWLIAWVRRVPPDVRRVMMMTMMSYNSGNYGLPLQDMAFGAVGRSAEAMLYQAFVMITQNLSNFTWGIFVISGGKKDRSWQDNLLHIAKFPPIWAMVAGVATMQIRIWMGPQAAGSVGEALTPIWRVVLYIKGAFIAIALCTLGAQLATVKRDGERYPVAASVVLRLLIGPAIGLAIIYAFGIGGFLAQVLLIGTTCPTAVNCMLLAMEFDNHPDFAAKAVFYSTLLSPITVTLCVFLAQGGLLPGF